ncbi:hypothetical protein BC941DRAFT_432843 [Chlamydoabsidia padenii]|nr:hypothetical protein BC941DRAFT_432843 [Chlamydoabsidia padenii]
MKAKIESLEQKLKHDHEVFEKQRSVLLEEIKMKDNQLVEKQKQWESQWSTKMEEIQQQLEMQQKVHENDILEWKTRYQEALDTEQEKHHRRLAYFHERLTAKNVEYAQLEQQLVQSAPTSPVQQQQHIVPVSIDKKKMEDNETTHRWRRSASLNDGPMKRPVIITPANNLRLETVLPRPNMFNKDERYAQELQDMTLRHQAAMDNMISEYEETRMELLAQHAREKEVWKIEQDAQLQEACTTLAQEHGAILDHVNQAWQQKWDDLKRDQLVQKQQWDQQLDAAKLEWESRHAKEQAELKKQLSWSKGELHMMLKEHETALRLAKQLNLIIDHTIDVDDMKFTLLGLLEVGIKHASRLDTQTYLVEKASEPFFGFMNLSFF